MACGSGPEGERGDPRRDGNVPVMGALRVGGERGGAGGVAVGVAIRA